MANANVIKEYLVSLGFSVDEEQYRKATGVVNQFGGMTSNAIGKFNANIAKGAATWVSAIGSTTAALGALAAQASESDEDIRKFARRMWMSEQNARSLNQALTAMGESMDTINDIAADPALIEDFMQLRRDSMMYASKDVDEAMIKIDNVMDEFDRFKLFIENAGRYIAYYLTQYLGKPMERIQEFLSEWNDKGVEHANKWGKRIGKFGEIIFRMGETAVKTIKRIWDRITELPTKAKVVLGIIAGIGLIVAAPWIGVAAAITAVIALLDDYYTYQAGGESALTELWKQVDELKEAVQPMIDLLSDLWDKIEPYITVENVGVVAALWGAYEALKAIAGLVISAETLAAIKLLLFGGGNTGALLGGAAAGKAVGTATGVAEGATAGGLLSRIGKTVVSIGETAYLRALYAADALVASGAAETASVAAGPVLGALANGFLTTRGYLKDIAEKGYSDRLASQIELREDADFNPEIFSNGEAGIRMSAKTGWGWADNYFEPAMANTTQYTGQGYTTKNEKTEVSQDNRINYSPTINVHTNNPQNFATRMQTDLRARIEQTQRNRSSSGWSNGDIGVE